MLLLIKLNCLINSRTEPIQTREKLHHYNQAVVTAFDVLIENSFVRGSNETPFQRSARFVLKNHRQPIQTLSYTQIN